MREYATLLVAQFTRGLVTYPDGTTSEHDPAEAVRIAREWGATPQRHRADPQVRAPGGDAGGGRAAETQAMSATTLAAWKAGLDAFLADTATSISEYDYHRERYIVAHPPPSRGDGVVSDALDATATSETGEPVVVNVARWGASLNEADGTDTLEILDAEAGSHVHRVLPAVLTAKSVEGWELVHVSEARTVRHSADASSAVLDAITFLLARERPHLDACSQQAASASAKDDVSGG